MKTEFDASWKEWIQINVAAGHSKDSLFKILLDEGYAHQAIKQALDYEPSVPAFLLNNPLKSDKQPQHKYGPKLQKNQLFLANARKLATPVVAFVAEDFCLADERHTLTECLTQNISAQPDNALGRLDRRLCRYVGIEPSYATPVGSLTNLAASKGNPELGFMLVLNVSTAAIPIESLDLLLAPGMLLLVQNSPAGSADISQLFSPLDGTGLLYKTFLNRSQLEPAPNMFSKEANEFIPNYTFSGLMKLKLAPGLFADIASYYLLNMQHSKEENVPGDFMFNRHKRVSSTLIELPQSLKNRVHDELKPLVERWCQAPVEPTYVYGVRTYHEGAALKLHRDRIETHILGVIINVDQEVNQPWPLVIEDNYYRRHEVFLKPGEVLFYEGARLKHGRPTPFDGKRFANIFCHFTPKGYLPRTF